MDPFPCLSQEDEQIRTNLRGMDHRLREFLRLAAHTQMLLARQREGLGHAGWVRWLCNYDWMNRDLARAFDRAFRDGEWKPKEEGPTLWRVVWQVLGNLGGAVPPPAPPEDPPVQVIQEMPGF